MMNVLICSYEEVRDGDQNSKNCDDGDVESNDNLLIIVGVTIIIWDYHDDKSGHDCDEWVDDDRERRSHNDHVNENDADHREALMLHGDHKERYYDHDY